MIEMYIDYIKERENAEVIYNNRGFMSYKVEKDGVFIMDAYVKPFYRKENVAKKLLEEIVEKTNTNKLYTSTDLNANNWETSEKVILALGFKKIGRLGNSNYYIKEIK